MATSKMSDRQWRYAERRLHEVMEARRAALIKACQIKNDVLTIAQVIKGIKNGTFKPPEKLAVDEPMRRHYSVTQLFVLPELKEPASLDQPRYNAELKQLEADFKEAMDRVILGEDGAGLLRIITKFEEGRKPV